MQLVLASKKKKCTRMHLLVEIILKCITFGEIACKMQEMEWTVSLPKCNRIRIDEPTYYWKGELFPMYLLYAHLKGLKIVCVLGCCCFFKKVKNKIKSPHWHHFSLSLQQLFLVIHHIDCAVFTKLPIWML